MVPENNNNIALISDSEKCKEHQQDTRIKEAMQRLRSGYAGAMQGLRRSYAGAPQGLHKGGKPQY